MDTLSVAVWVSFIGVDNMLDFREEEKWWHKLPAILRPPIPYKAVTARILYIVAFQSSVISIAAYEFISWLI